MLIPVSDYSTDQINESSSHCPAIKRYLTIVDAFDDLKKITQFQRLTVKDEYSENLTLIRHQIWLNCALATYFNKFTPEQICKYWSDQVDLIILSAWEHFELHKEEVLLTAMGKLGAQELNLSSDVDLVILSEFTPDQSIIKKVQQFTGLLSNIHSYGFILRVDYNLRPGGRFGPLVSSLNQFQDYYWSQGETWEKLALGRFRILNHKEELSEKIIKIKNKFSFRKYIDYTLFDDLKNIRQQIRENYFNKNHIKSIDLKLGQGGIRDIELYLHALQIIHGGRIPEIRTVSTTQLCENLESYNLLDDKHGKILLKAYWKYREIENKVQIFEDQQTHQWNDQLNYPKLDKESSKELIHLTHKINDIVAELLGPILHDQNPLPETLDQQLEWLKNHNFKEHVINEVWPQLIELTARSVRGQKDEAIRKKFLYHFVEELKRIDLDYNLGLNLLFDFIKSTRMKASFFSLLSKEKRLITDLAMLFSTSPYLGNIISSRPEILDNYFLNSRAQFSDEFDILLEQLTENRLLSELISSKEFLHSKNIENHILSLSSTADKICIQLLSRLKAQYKNSSIEILTLGKWGGQEIGLKSDLDFIFICFKLPNENDFKVARRFLSRLSDQHKGGSLYEVDLRLRPSGKAGPLIVTWERLTDYLKNEAETWESQAYLRARFLNIQNNIRYLNDIHQSIYSKNLDADRFDELIRIRKALSTKSNTEFIDLKHTPGGLVDIEFCAQISSLKEKLEFNNSSTSSMYAALCVKRPELKGYIEIILSNYNKMRTWEQLHQLISSHSGSKIFWSSENFSTLAKLLSLGPQDLKKSILTCYSSSLHNLMSVDPNYFSR
jgi:glutamate-ammonia-ligase adenylyltransferase